MTEERLIYIVDFQNQKRDPQLVSHFNPTSEILSASQEKNGLKISLAGIHGSPPVFQVIKIHLLF